MGIYPSLFFILLFLNILFPNCGPICTINTSNFTRVYFPKFQKFLCKPYLHKSCLTKKNWKNWKPVLRKFDRMENSIAGFSKPEFLRSSNYLSAYIHYISLKIRCAHEFSESGLSRLDTFSNLTESEYFEWKHLHPNWIQIFRLIKYSTE